jgi:hypothetical protein
MLLGAEGDGLSSRWLHEADVSVRIPMSKTALDRGVDSLNVVAAAAISRTDSTISRFETGKSVLPAKVLAKMLELPFAAGAHPSIHSGGFTVLSVGLDESTGYEIVYTEHRTGCLYIDKRPEVDEHKLVFDHLRAKALDREASRALIRRTAREMTKE